MINYANESLFVAGSIDKQYSIRVYNGNILETTITNNKLYSQEFELHKSICSEETLRYGSCEASYVKFKVTADVGTLKNKKLLVFCTIEEETLQIGEFYVVTDELSGDRTSREVTAYDKVYNIINTDMLEWYGEIGLPLTMKQFRDAFFNYFGITQENVTLVNDGMVITETILAEQLSGIEILNAILSGNGCLGTIDNEGKFRYVFLNDYDTKAYGKNYKQGTLKYEDYNVRPITALRFFSNNDIDITVGTTEGNANVYVMEDNFLFYDKLESDLTIYVQNIFNVISETPAFKPLEVETYGNLCVEVGDYITFTNYEGSTIGTFVFQKTISGLQSLSDSFITEGTEYFEYDLNSTNSQIRRLWNNTIALQQEADKARTYVYAQRNNQPFSLTHNTETEIININFATTDITIPVFLATIPLTMSLDGEVTFRYYLNGLPIREEDWEDTIYLTKGKQFVTISTFFEAAANQRYTFSVKAQTGYRESVERQQTAKIISLKDWIDNQSITISGDTASFDYDYVESPIDTTPPGATIDKLTIRSMIFGSGLANNMNWDGTLLLIDEVSDWNLIEITFANANESVSVAPFVPVSGSFTDTVTVWNLIEIPFESAEDTLAINMKIDSYRRILEDDSVRITEDESVRYTEGD